VFVFVLFQLLNIHNHAKAQATSPPKSILNVMPPSPNAASLGKYGEIPVSNYTGIPNINIPIYEIKIGDLTLPISLNYHAGGVKVEEIASWVGLGWSLNAGGMIGRSVRGIPDEVAQWYPMVGEYNPSNTIESIMNSSDNTRKDQLLLNVEKGDTDGEGDLYYFNFSKYSGKFFFDQAGNPHTMPQQKLKVERVNAWKVTGEDGNVYTFNKEETTSTSTCSSDNNVISAWYLTSIKSSDGQREIIFTYEPIIYTYTTLGVETKYLSLNSTDCGLKNSNCITTNNYRTFRLSRIDFTGGYIKFNASNTRCDLVDDKSLDQIEIYSQTKLIKRFNLDYKYFGDNSDGVNRFTEDRKRLVLTSVREENVSTTSSGVQVVTQKPPYTFHYNETMALPPRLSYAQDHWGYFNGKTNNPGLIPTYTYVSFSGVVMRAWGADRSVNTNTSQAGILTKIVYPTQGETEFKYENNTTNDFRADPQVEEKNINLIAVKSAAMPNPYLSYEKLVVPLGGAVVKYSVTGLDCVQQPPTNECDFWDCKIELMKEGQVEPYRWISKSWDGFEESLPEGTYQLRAKVESGCYVANLRDFAVTITALIPVVAPDGIKPVGGLRIAQIKDIPNDGGLPITKTYKYHLENDISKSSGTVINFPLYEYSLGATKVDRDEFNAPLKSTTCSYRVRQSYSSYPLATSKGSYVGYSHVIVDLGETGESRYTYTTAQDSPQTSYPYAPTTSYEWRRGNLESEKLFKRQNNQLIKVREVYNEYGNFNERRVIGVKTGRIEVFIDAATQLYAAIPPTYNTYITLAEFYSLSLTRERIYNQDDASKYIENITTYEYNPAHLQLAQTTQFTKTNQDASLEEKKTAIFKYPFDYIFNGTPIGRPALGIKHLQDKHIASAVIEKYVIEQKKNPISNSLQQQVVSGNITTYYPDKPYPETDLALETINPILLTSFANGSSIKDNGFDRHNAYKTKITYDKYDNWGNLLQYHKEDDLPTTYLWGYNNTYPVAEIKNASYNDVKIALSIQPSNEVSLGLGALNQSQLTALKTNLPLAMITTLTYDPLIGMTSSTDPSGIITYYEYDDLGRLKLIKDHDQNIVKEYVYHYKSLTPP
jgi:YD repeat-containing protein